MTIDEIFPLLPRHYQRNSVLEHISWQDCVYWLPRPSERAPAMSVEGRKVSVRRYLYEKVKGPIPEGYNVKATCRHARCINPGHAVAFDPKLAGRIREAGLRHNEQVARRWLEENAIIVEGTSVSLPTRGRYAELQAMARDLLHASGTAPDGKPLNEADIACVAALADDEDVPFSQALNAWQRAVAQTRPDVEARFAAMADGGDVNAAIRRMAAGE